MIVPFQLRLYVQKVKFPAWLQNKLQIIAGRHHLLSEIFVQDKT
uniref:Uncharacterized protein n=1 Tax=Arundo donax TaxID=35708 RepID=A0A0A9B4K0_ARUDO